MKWFDVPIGATFRLVNNEWYFCKCAWLRDDDGAVPIEYTGCSSLMHEHGADNWGDLEVAYDPLAFALEETFNQ